MSFFDENFFYNCMLAKALVQLLPPNDRKTMRSWFAKLTILEDDQESKELRNEYMWFMLLMLQCNKLREPFLSPPPAEVPPLREAVDEKTYEEILISNDDMSWLEDLTAGAGGGEKKKVQFQRTAPSQFYYSQPVPAEGVVCYMSAFSDRGL